MTRSTRRSFWIRVPRLAAAGLALASLGAAPAGAALLPATGTFSYTLGAYSNLISVSGAGLASSSGGPGSAHTVPSGFFQVGSAIAVPISPTFTGLDLVTVPAGAQNGAGSFSPNGAMGLQGSAFFYGFGAPAGQVPLAPMGGGGSQAITFIVLPAVLHGGTFMGAGGPTPMVFSAMSAVAAVPITAAATAFDNRTSGGQGTVQLVAPAKLSFQILGSVPIFATLQITYTPEPGTLLLLGAGIAFLAAAGTRRMPRTG